MKKDIKAINDITERKLAQTYCRNCFSKAPLRYVVGDDDIYLLCDKCMEDLSNGKLMEKDIKTYGMSNNVLIKIGNKLDDKWRRKVYGGMK